MPRPEPQFPWTFIEARNNSMAGTQLGVWDFALGRTGMPFAETAGSITVQLRCRDAKFLGELGLSGSTEEIGLGHSRKGHGVTSASQPSSRQWATWNAKVGSPCPNTAIRQLCGILGEAKVARILAINASGEALKTATSLSHSALRVCINHCGISCNHWSTSDFTRKISTNTINMFLNSTD